MELAIEFFKPSHRRYRSVLHRADGVEIGLDGGSYNKIGGKPGEVPHDLAHLIVEEEFRLTDGVWGVLAKGGLFRNASVLRGRQRPHATRRAAEILAASGPALNQAELYTRAVCDLCLADRADLRALRSAIGEVAWLPPASSAALARSFDRLRRTADEWAALPPDSVYSTAFHAA